MNKRNFIKGLTKVLFSLCLLLTVCVLNSNEIKADEKRGYWWYEVLQDGTVRITDYIGEESNVTVPSKLGGRTVTEIGAYGDWVFAHNSYIKSVIIPSTVKIIERSQFYKCVNLKTVSGCAGVESIGYSAFAGCSNLESVALGNKLKEIGGWAFDECGKIKTMKIPYLVTYIGDRAFKNCDGLTSLTLSSNVTIDEFAFYDCDALTSVKFGVNTVLCERAFADCDELQTVEFSEGTIYIPYGCFRNCKKLKNVSFGPDLSAIGQNAFEACKSLEKIDLPASVRVVGYQAFAGCISVKNITLRYGLIAIGEDAFCSNPSITSVIIPNSVTSVYDEPFWGCSNLEYVVAPRSITNITNMNGLGYSGTFSGALVKCYANSYVYNWAVENDLRVEIINDEIPSTGLSFSTTSKKIFSRETYKIPTTVTPSNTTDAIVWTSSDESIATVNGIGEVTGVNPGKCTIIARTTSGKSAVFSVTVIAGPNKVNFSSASKVGVVGKSFTYKPTAKDNNGVRKDVKYTFRSSDKTIATVSNTGVVTPKKAGNVIISADTPNGIRATYALTVVNTMSLTNSNISKKLNVISCVYNGKARTPSVIATLNGTKLIKGTDFTVTYKNNTYPGTALVVVTGKGKFTGSVTLKMTIKALSLTAKQNTSVYSTNSVSLKWSKVDGVNGYDVYRSTSASTGYKKVKSTTGVSYKNTGLSSGKIYYYKVKGYKTVSGTKKYIATSTAVKTSTRPATPVAKVTAGTKKATITWMSVTGASGYEVYMSKSKTGTYSKIKAVSSSTKSVSKTGLTKGKRYYFKVKAYKTINGIKVFSGASTVVSVVVK